jgi:hypothetical protein
MMRATKLAVIAGFASLFLAVSAFAAERGTPEEAKALVEKAVAHAKAVGITKALADFHLSRPCGRLYRSGPLRFRL